MVYNFAVLVSMKFLETFLQESLSKQNMKLFFRLLTVLVITGIFFGCDKLYSPPTRKLSLVVTANVYGQIDPCG